MALPYFPWPPKKTLTVGIDLGVDAAKVICLKSSKSGYQLMAHALLRREQLGMIREFLHHPSLKGADIRLAIQVPQLKMQRLSVPIVPREELAPIVTWAFKEATNLSVDDFIVRFYQTGVDAESQKLNILAFAIEKSFFSQWLNFIHSTGIEGPNLAEPDIQSLANLINFNYSLKEGNRCVIIDIGKSQSQLAVVSHLGIEFFRPLSGVGTDYLSSNVSQELGWSSIEAENNIVELGNSGTCKRQDEVIDIINSYCEKFCVQAQYAIENYINIAKDQPITNILLAGGGARLKGLKEHIQDTLHFPTDLLDPFTQFSLGRFNERDFDNSKTIYAVAAGLAL
jgi:type IV pilus assembly protein PilM